MKRFSMAWTCLALTAIVGCASTRPGDAPQSYLSPSVGLVQPQPSSYESFASYADAIESQLTQHRVPFDSSQAELEIQRAKTEQFNPDDGCKANPLRGIVILVHGLSDTAFTMKEVAKVVAANCYVARAILLPGHGTRSGDLLVTDLTDWRNTVRELVRQASNEHENVLVAGFSLGAVLSLSVALEEESEVDALIAFSPAYSLSSYKLARLAPYFHRVMRWIDRELPDDYARYEAMPTRGVAETVKGMKLMHRQLKSARTVDIPWLMIQSMDDAVIEPEENIRLFRKHASHSQSRIVNFYTSQNVDDDLQTTWIPGASKEHRVLGITHTGITYSAANVHYGLHGDYRNCGQTAPREKARVDECLKSDEVWYGLWNKPSPQHLPTARSSFNPQFNELVNHLGKFLLNWNAKP